MNADAYARLIGTDTVVFERHAPCPSGDAWRAVTDSDALAAWFIPATLDFRDGGRFEFHNAWGGEIRDIVPGRRVTYVADAGGRTTFELEGRHGDTLIRLTDRMGPVEAPTDAVAGVAAEQPGGPGSHWAGVVAGWHGFMDALVRHLGGVESTADASAADVTYLTRCYAERLRQHFRERRDA